MNLLNGWKTYAVVAVLLLTVAIEKLLGVDVPGIVITDDWGLVVLNALGLGALRSSFAATVAK